MNRIATIALLLLTACATRDEQAVLRALHAGAAQYRATQYADAAATFANAPSDARLNYNQGTALHRANDLDQAVTVLQDAAQMADSADLKTLAWYNLGNSRLLQARRADSLSKAYTTESSSIKIEGDDIAKKVNLYVLRDSLRRESRRMDNLVDSALRAGSDGYKHVLRMAPTDEDARHNLVVIQRQIAARKKASNGKGGDGNNKDKELGERAKLIIQKADELVEQHLFQEALNVLQKGLNEDPTLQQRKEYMEKLGVVTKAAAGQ
jgi:tetratricopeptide (TPR) repeat protein